MIHTLVQTLMDSFAAETGIVGNNPPRRYLWTDAFAVCNFIGLSRQTGDGRYLNLARTLVEQVHHILGRHRRDDPRQGWISGLSEDEGEKHPTCGGLRIGKLMNERGPDQPPDEQLEWERDGQYYHYLTKWMHALFRMGQKTGESRYQHWAVELAVSAHKAFTRELIRGSPKRMVWKLSIDLSRPLVASMGQHDPLDGLITCLELQTAEGIDNSTESHLTAAITDLTAMTSNAHLATADPLGIGGLLDAATRLAQLIVERGAERHELLQRVLFAAESSLREFVRSSPFPSSAEHRLAFRELGLSIGLHGLPKISPLVQGDVKLAAVCAGLLQFQPLADQIELFWSEPAHRCGRLWIEHRDINTVMLATSLAPAAYLQV